MWSSVSAKLAEELQKRQLVSEVLQGCFLNLDTVIAHVEREVVPYLGKIEQNWLKRHPVLLWRHQMQLDHQVAFAGGSALLGGFL